jgi:hypothetical protein
MLGGFELTQERENLLSTTKITPSPLEGKRRVKNSKPAAEGLQGLRSLKLNMEEIGLFSACRNSVPYQGKGTPRLTSVLRPEGKEDNAALAQADFSQRYLPP